MGIKKFLRRWFLNFFDKKSSSSNTSGTGIKRLKVKLYQIKN